MKCYYTLSKGVDPDSPGKEGFTLPRTLPYKGMAYCNSTQFTTEGEQR